jgi:hypothetical protein
MLDKEACSMKKRHKEIETRLIEELSRLQRLFSTGYRLTLKYIPSRLRCLQNGTIISGEVKGERILIYEKDEENAISTLRHEFLDYTITQAIKPYQNICNIQRTIINTIFKHLEDYAYSEKEKVVDQLLRVLSFLDDANNTPLKNGTSRHPNRRRRARN